MLFPNATVSVSRQVSSAPYVTGQEVYFHTRGLNETLQMLATGQPLHTFMSDNSGSPPPYKRGDIVTFMGRLNTGTMPPQTQWTIDDIDVRGDFSPYVHCQLTAVSQRS